MGIEIRDLRIRDTNLRSYDTYLWIGDGKVGDSDSLCQLNVQFVTLIRENIDLEKYFLLLFTFVLSVLDKESHDLKVLA